MSSVANLVYPGTAHPPIEGVIPLFNYELCFHGGTDPAIDVTTTTITADSYEPDELGEGDHSVASVVFLKDVPDPDDADETLSLKMFELPAHRVVFIKNLGEVDEPKARCGGDLDEAAEVPAGDVAAAERGGQLYVDTSTASND